MATFTTRLPFDKSELVARFGEVVEATESEIVIRIDSVSGVSTASYRGSFVFDQFGNLSEGRITDHDFRDFDQDVDYSIEGGDIDALSWFSFLSAGDLRSAYDLWFVDGGTFIGSSGDDVLRGGPSDDVFFPGGGDDEVDGGGGENRAVFSGRQADFDVEVIAGGMFVLVDDRRIGPDSEGFNFLQNIQILEFSDEVVLLEDLGDPGMSRDPDIVPLVSLALLRVTEMDPALVYTVADTVEAPVTPGTVQTATVEFLRAEVLFDEEDDEAVTSLPALAGRYVDGDGAFYDFLIFELPFSNTVTFVPIGGAPLPVLEEREDALAFLETLVSAGPIPEGPTGPGTELPLKSLPLPVGLEFSPIEHVSFAARLAEGDLETLDAVADSYLRDLFGPLAGIATLENVSFAGDAAAAGWVEDFRIPALVPGLDDLAFGSGIMLSTGSIPNETNTAPAFTVPNLTPGDPDLDASALQAFSGAGETFDALTISFTLDVTDARFNTLRMGLVFGSEEFPEFIDSEFVDIAAVYVNGVNVALFDNDPTLPLSVISGNVSGGNFIDNDFGAGQGVSVDDPDLPNSRYGIEWNAFSNLLSVRAPLQQGENTIKIGIADTGDPFLDSGLFVSRLELAQGGGAGTGVLNQVDASDGGTVVLSDRAEEVLIGAAPVALTGTASAFDNDVIVGFKPEDSLTIEDAVFTSDQITVTYGSARLEIDTDGDGSADTTITFAGDFAGTGFAAQPGAQGTTITTFELGDPPDTVSLGVAIRDPGGALLDQPVQVTAQPEGGAPGVATAQGGVAALDVPAGGAVDVSAQLDYVPGETGPGIGTASALQALRLAVGLNPAWGEAQPHDFVAADFDGDGRVTTADALEILRVAVGLSTDAAPRYVFVDSAGLEGIDARNVEFTEGTRIDSLTANSQTELTAILVGNVVEY